MHGVTKDMYFIIKGNMKLQWNGNFDWLIYLLFIFSYDKAIKIDPKDKEILNRRGNVFYN